MKRQILSDGMWVTVAQVTSALGALATVRILTALLTPEQFGLLTLSIGVITLVQLLFCNPILQALLRYYPDFCEKGNLAELCAVSKAITFQRASLLSTIGLVVGVGTHLILSLSIVTVLLLNMFLFAEIWRSYEVNLFNPTRRQKEFAAVTMLEACLRPASAWLLAHVLGYSIEVILLAFVSTSVVSALLSKTFAQYPSHKHDIGGREPTKTLISQFSMPLMPLAIVNWCNGTLDRYIIAAVLGSGEAGIYAAASGLVSRPFLMFGHVVEQTLRPVYYEATSRSDNRLANKIHHLWIALMGSAGILGFLIFFIYGDRIAQIFLGEHFKDGTIVMPWIALGYGVMAVVQALGRQFYAIFKTRQILVIEGSGLLAMITIFPISLTHGGIVGAAVAFLVGTIVQLIVTFLAISARWKRLNKFSALPKPI
jgi:O-antigen/teichoic acid export membrane protein